MDILTKIKLYNHQCKEHKCGCNNCPNLMKDGKCRVKEICYLMARAPWDWDIEKIERIYNA